MRFDRVTGNSPDNMRGPVARQTRRAEQDQYRIAVRFGDVVLASGHTAIPNLLLNRYASLSVSPAEMLFVIHVFQFWWTERDPYPSLATLAERMGVSRRQVRNYVAGLKAKKLLVVSERFVEGLGQVSSEYDFEPLLTAVRASGDESDDTPRKDPSEGPRKEISAEEDKDQEDEDLISRSARAHAGIWNPPRLASLTTPLLRQNSGLSHSTRHEPTSVGDLLSKRFDRIPNNRPSATSTAEGRRAFHGKPFTTPQLDAAIAELSAAVGDDRNLGVNRSRARNVMQRSGLTESGFVALLYRAYSLYRERLRSEGTSVQRGGAYFFAIVEDLLPAPPTAQPLLKAQTEGVAHASGIDAHPSTMSREKRHPGGKLAYSRRRHGPT